MKKEDKVALYVSGGLHVALVAFFLLYTFSVNMHVRPSYMEVKVGKFKMGTQAQHAKKKHKKVAKNPNPSKKQPKHPQPNHSKSEKPKKKATKKEVKPVHSPKQKKKVKSEKLKTPKTKKVNPRKKTAEKKTKKATKKTTKKEVHKAVIPPKAQKAKKQKKGAQKSGSKKGTKGKANADEGSGSQKDKSAPYNLNIKGINRNPVHQPLPGSISNYNATVTLRFEVTPQGRVTNIIPIHKSGDPQVDREVIKTLKGWRFSRLPSNAPQENQTGTITFHFVLH
jgi:TonB family protein